MYRMCVLFTLLKKAPFLPKNMAFRVAKYSVIKGNIDVNKYYERSRKLSIGMCVTLPISTKKHCPIGVVITLYRWTHSIPSKRNKKVSDRIQCEGMMRIR